MNRIVSFIHERPVARSTVALLSCLLVVGGCKPEKEHPIEAFNAQRAFEEVVALVEYTPRDAGTPGGRKAAEHIHQRLKLFGISAEIDTFTDRTPAGEKTMHNVVGRIPGRSDEWIIVGSHFDTMPGIENFQGANDGGSSTGVLLELARVLADSKPETGIIFAFFDGEEGIAHYIEGDGLHGSRHMAKQLLTSGQYKKTKAMILLDMVGDKDLHFILPGNSSQALAKVVLDAAHATGHRKFFSLSNTSFITDDHVPFQQIGIPAIDLIDFKYGSRPDKNDYWHTDRDNLENISADSLEVSGSVVLESVKTLAGKQMNQ